MSNIEQLEALAQIINKYGWKTATLALVFLFAMSYFQIGNLQSQLETQVGSTFYGMQKQANYIISHAHGSSTIVGMQNGTTAKFDMWSANMSAILYNARGNLTDGGSIFIKAGATYLLGNTVDFSSTHDIKVLSDGAILKWNATPTRGFDVTDSLRFEVSGLVLIGNAGEGRTGIYGDNANFTTIKDCRIEGWGYAGICLEGKTNYNTIENNVINNITASDACGLYVVNWVGTSSGNKILKNTISNVTGENIETWGLRDSIISENIINGSGGIGIEVQASVRVIVSNNYVRIVDHPAFQIVEGSQNCSIVNNIFIGSGDNAKPINCQNSSYCSFIGNTVLHEDNLICIQVTYASHHCFFAANTVTFIFITHESGACDYNRFFGNFVEILMQWATPPDPDHNTYVGNYPDNTP